MELPTQLEERLVALERMGAEVDHQAALWLADQTGEYDKAALRSIAEARRLIELTVDMALSSGCASHRAVVQMQKSWSDRFAQIGERINSKQIAMGRLVQLHVDRTHAAKAYVKTQGLSDL
ncbi:MAG: hypothetical protein PHT38_01800 [Halothiobacillus sp.]|nr:hypothetical protein [Halothiobacillus sp.]